MRSKRSVVTIQDVAQTAGVSVSTVSRVLNNKDDVAPETTDKVRQVIKDLNYTASLAARSMRSRKSKVIGLILPELTESFDMEIIKGAGAAIRDSGYDLMIYTSGRRPLDRRASWELDQLALLKGGLTDGCIIVTPAAPVFPDNERIVVIDPNGDGAAVTSVVARNRIGALYVMEYLTGLGHRRIGFIGGRKDTLSANRRLTGYRDGLACAGIAFDPALVQAGDYSRESGQSAARQLLTLAERPTAIFAANDQSAFGVMDVAEELGLRIPEDLSLVGFDNIPEAAQVSPKLTTIDQSIKDMGMIAMKLLLDMLQGIEPEEKLVKVPTSLIIRDSCRAISS